MLPYQLVNDLRHHVDTATQTRFDYVVQRLEPQVVDLRMYWMVIESDAILDITTEARTNVFDYATSLRATLRDARFLDPSMCYVMHCKRTRRNGPAEQTSLSGTSSTIYARPAWKRYSVEKPNSRPWRPAAVAPLDQLQERITTFKESLSQTPPRRSPVQRSRRLQYDVVTRQYKIAMGSPYGRAFHLRDPTYQRQQEFLYRANVQEQYTRYSKAPTVDYTILEPLHNATSTVMDVAEESDNSNEDGYEIPLHRRSPASQDKILMHTNSAALRRSSSGQSKSNVIAGLTLQAMVANPTFFDEGQISDQRAYELGHPSTQEHQDDDDGPNEQRYSRAFAYLMQDREPPFETSEAAVPYSPHAPEVSSNTARTIALMNAQAAIDTAPGTTGSSSSALAPILPTETSYRPKPSNFGLERCERYALHRQALAVEAMQRVSSYNLSDAEARAMLAAADGVRSQSWLSGQHQEEAREESPANPPTTVAMRTRSKLAQSARNQIANSRPLSSISITEKATKSQTTMTVTPANRTREQQMRQRVVSSTTQLLCIIRSLPPQTPTTI